MREAVYRMHQTGVCIHRLAAFVQYACTYGASRKALSVGPRFSVSDIYTPTGHFTALAPSGRHRRSVHRSAALIEMAGISYEQ